MIQSKKKIDQCLENASLRKVSHYYKIKQIYIYPNDTFVVIAMEKLIKVGFT